MKKIFDMNKTTEAARVLSLFDDNMVSGYQCKINIYWINNKQVLLVDTPGADHLEKKPAPDTYKHVAQTMLHVEAKHAIAVEDTPKGALASTQAGYGLTVITANGDREGVRQKFIGYCSKDGVLLEVERLEEQGRLLFMNDLHEFTSALSRARDEVGATTRGSGSGSRGSA